MSKDILRGFFRRPTAAASSVSFLAFIVYLRTLAPSVGFIDSGELAAVACTLGIAHPTGYPLFTLLGWLFSNLPIASEEIVRLNIMGAIFSSAGVFLFFLVVHAVLTELVRGSGWTKTKLREEIELMVIVASVGSALLLAFSKTYWSQAISVEVYSLHAFFLSAVILVFFRASHARALPGEERVDSGIRLWLLSAFLLGLSFTNHMTTILLVPGLIYLYFSTQGAKPPSRHRIGYMFLPFLAGLSVYLYLPLRASQSPVFNWGNPASFEKIFWHLRGKQYSVWIFSSMEVAGKQLRYFFDSLPQEFAVVGLLLAVPGIFMMWKSNRKIAITFLMLFLSCVVYSINYDIHDIDSYFFLAYFVVALLAGSGLLLTFKLLRSGTTIPRTLIAVGLLALCALPLVMHFEKVDESQNYLVEDYTMNMFASLKPNALVFSFQWDFWLSASYYFQHVKGIRPDIAVVDKELLRRSWYFKELEGRYPWLIQESKREIDLFLTELDKFERNLPYNPNVIQSRFVEMIQSLVKKSMNSRPVYVTGEIEPEFTAGLQRIPEGLAFRVESEPGHHVAQMPSFLYRPFNRQGRLEDKIRDLYASAFVAAGANLYSGGDRAGGEAMVKTALEYSKFHPQALGLLTRISQPR